ncbi:TetR/AcrR family transcriptional regulator [Kerstersia similis]|uniref:TetR/AcrR family transcriptional regulator n=1 Tax=Kerstersia similis TaxID=206505 RepID=UPI0039F0B626
MDMRAHIIEVAGSLFYAEGIRAVGVDRIIAEAGIAKATLYRHFATKEALVVAYLRDRYERITQYLREQVLESGEQDPAEKAVLPYRILQEMGARTEYRGCAFLLAVAENEGCAPVLEVAREYRRWLHQMFTELVACLTDDAEALANELTLCYEGAMAAMAIHREPAAADVAHRCAFALIRARQPVPVASAA